MGEEDESDVTLGDFQELITRVVAVATVNRWSFRIEFASDGAAELIVTVPPDDRR